MKLKALIPLTISLAVIMVAHGQTNTAVVDTNAVASTVIVPPKPVRPMSLQDCLQEALQNNFDIQISRLDPQISLFVVKSDQGAYYDPVLSLGAEYDYGKFRGRVDTNGLVLPPGTTKNENVSSDLTGNLPWGMNYDLKGAMNEQYGIGQNGYYNGIGNGSQVSATLTQPLLKNFWIDTARLTILLDKSRYKSSQWGLRLQFMTTVTTVENAYYDLIAAQENVKVQEKGVELANQLLAENKKRVEVGALAPLDEKQAESQVATARADLLTARQTLASQQNTLKILLTQNYRESHDIDIQPTETMVAPVQIFNLQDSWSKGMAQRPDLQQAKLTLEQQGITLKFNRNQLFPQLDVYGSYGYAAGSDTTITYSDGFDDIRRGDQPFYNYGVKFSIPLSNRKPRNDYKAAKLTVQQALLTLKQKEQSILAEIDNDVIAAKASFERVDATREARAYAEDALDAEQKKLQSGKSTSFVVLQLQKNLTDARSQEIQALADYNKSLATLSQAEGGTLERRNLDVRMK